MPNLINGIIPARWEICPDCDGDGGTSSHLGSFTSSEWAEMDDEWKDDYMGGAFDRPCPTCSGSGKVLTPIADLCVSDEAKAALDAYYEDLSERAYDRRRRESEYHFEY